MNPKPKSVNGGLGFRYAVLGLMADGVSLFVFEDLVPYAFQTETQNHKPWEIRVQMYIGFKGLRAFGIQGLVQVKNPTILPRPSTPYP